MASLAKREWVPAAAESLVQQVASSVGPDVLAELDRLVALNHQIHDVDTINLNPATNVMNPRAEAMLSKGLGSRPSLGYPGEKYEMGLEAIEQIEVIAAELVAEVFGARYAEVRVPSGAIANLYAFLATCEPGDTIIAPPPSIGGHVTHHLGGSAGMYRLKTVPHVVDASRYSVDVSALRELAHRVKPRVITVGQSLNLTEHPVAAVREIADEVGAFVLFDAAHACGLIAGGVWANPLDEGAHMMTFSTYKSLGGPAGGVVVTNDAEIAERLDHIAYPGLTANFDAAKTAALAVTMVDWKTVGAQYAETMVANSLALAAALESHGLPLYSTSLGPTTTHQFAVVTPGGGQAASQKLRRANLLACGIGLPLDPVEGDTNGLRLGTPEITRLGMQPEHMPALADFIVRGLGDNPESVAPEVTAWRRQFSGVHYIA